MNLLSRSSTRKAYRSSGRAYPGDSMAQVAEAVPPIAAPQDVITFSFGPLGLGDDDDGMPEPSMVYQAA